ncbi:MAG TPA: hypothetical protein VL494_10130 [Steroidobacteraceae bacterium]|jgi:hypothetical protein|nr:hypothetical protein [Steroidobacteraceae bacterium]
MATQSNPDAKPVDSRYVTALFRSPDAAERAYRAALALGYKDEDVNVVSSDATRDRLLADARHPKLSSNAAESKEQPTKGADLGGPTGGTFGTIAPVLAAVGAAVLVPGLVFAGPIAIALTAAGAVGLAGGLIGALKDWGIPQERVNEYETAVRNGAILIGVKARSDEDAQRLEQKWRAEGGR